MFFGHAKPRTPVFRENLTFFTKRDLGNLKKTEKNTGGKLLIIFDPFFFREKTFFNFSIRASPFPGISPDFRGEVGTQSY